MLPITARPGHDTHITHSLTLTHSLTHSFTHSLTPTPFLPPCSDETPLFDATSLQVLVMDEADRILDMGFRETLTAIVDNLPRRRQTLLFSATQTRSVGDLARLSLESPEFLAVRGGCSDIIM